MVKQSFVENIIIVLAILVFVLLIVKIRHEGTRWDCDNCKVTFYNQRQGSILQTDVPIQELYQEYLKDNCAVQWDRVNGYVGKNLTWQIKS